MGGGSGWRWVLAVGVGGGWRLGAWCDVMVLAQVRTWAGGWWLVSGVWRRVLLALPTWRQGLRLAAMEDRCDNPFCQHSIPRLPEGAATTRVIPPLRPRLLPRRLPKWRRGASRYLGVEAVLEVPAEQVGENPRAVPGHSAEGPAHVCKPAPSPQMARKPGLFRVILRRE